MKKEVMNGIGSVVDGTERIFCLAVKVCEHTGKEGAREKGDEESTGKTCKECDVI